MSRRVAEFAETSLRTSANSAALRDTFKKSASGNLMAHQPALYQAGNLSAQTTWFEEKRKMSRRVAEFAETSLRTSANSAALRDTFKKSASGNLMAHQPALYQAGNLSAQTTWFEEKRKMSRRVAEFAETSLRTSANSAALRDTFKKSASGNLMAHQPEIGRAGPRLSCLKRRGGV